MATTKIKRRRYVEWIPREMVLTLRRITNSGITLDLDGKNLGAFVV